MYKFRNTSIVIILILTFYSVGFYLYSKIENFPSSTNIETLETSESTGSIQGYKNYYRVVKVIDGDTIDVDINGVTTRVRLIGLDTPETVDPRKDIECFGNEASNKMHMLLDGKRVRLEEDLTQLAKDRYGRLLRYIFLEDGTHINEVIIKDGYGYEYTYDKPYAYQEIFKNAQAYAEANKLGLWAVGACH